MSGVPRRPHVFTVVQLSRLEWPKNSVLRPSVYNSVWRCFRPGCYMGCYTDCCRTVTSLAVWQQRRRQWVGG